MFARIFTFVMVATVLFPRFEAAPTPYPSSNPSPLRSPNLGYTAVTPSIRDVESEEQTRTLDRPRAVTQPSNFVDKK
uniref:Secreted protein n=1 Tax=Panagrellus redivivus TaxID=6233 RepID=A0A7E4VI98_PANRE